MQTMNCDETDEPGVKLVDESSAAVNSSILDYYKRFGRKRDLEQYFSLSTAESDVRDVSSMFWRNMKSQESSDSGERKSASASSNELCRISIKCSIPEPSSSQDENSKTKSDSESPPIITEENIETRHTDEESVYYEDNQSQKSMDALLDTSINKPLSPTSSVTSQRKLEWDSLADVGYANESDRKGSASSLSTLERLALKQQYSINDSKHDSEIGHPTSHSTPVEIDAKGKNKKGAIRKTTKIYKKDVDVVELNLHEDKDTNLQAINVSLTKHISFNMDKEGSVSVENVTNDVNVTSNKDMVEPDKSNLKTDKEIQTSLKKVKENSSSDFRKSDQMSGPMPPVLISLNSLKKKYRRKKVKAVRRKIRSKKKLDTDKENIPVQEKSGEQVSAAESFEYMPGHVYNQNQMNLEQPGRSPNADNKSSLESSGALTTDSSKVSKHSFTKDLEKSIQLLQVALQKQHNDLDLKNKLVKEVVQRLLKAKYRDDESTTDFLSGLTFSSNKLGLGESRITTSTSDSNNTESKSKPLRPKKSILRLDKFNSNVLASTSQSAPNLPSVSNNEKPVIPNPLKRMTSNTESDMSSGRKHSSDSAFAKTSSEELYQKYLEALRREETYKKHLREKEMFLKQKLVSSETALKVPQPDIKVNNRLEDLIKDLTRNNYDDGSGDASKLEGCLNSNLDFQSFNPARKQRSHSVFTLSSGNSDENRKANLKKRLQNEIKQTKAGQSRDGHHCYCPHHFVASKVGVADSSVQVDLRNESPNLKLKHPSHMMMPCNMHNQNRESPENFTHVLADDVTGDIKYVCLCSQKSTFTKEVPENMLIYKCSRLMTKGVQLQDSKTFNTVGVQCQGSLLSSPRNETKSQPSTSKALEDGKAFKLISRNSSDDLVGLDKISKSSQTNIALRLLERKSSEVSQSSSSANKKFYDVSQKTKENDFENINLVNEATRCVQTEISINPRIADPSLTDLNIMGDQDCVKLICECYRPVLKRNSESDIKTLNLKLNPDIENNSSEGSKTGTQVQNERDITSIIITNKSNKEIQSNLELNNKEMPVPKPDHYSTGNFTIPIQGTNMTLRVNIDSKSGNNGNGVTKKTEEMKSESVGTEKTDMIEKATCLTEECSKGVQSHAIDIFSGIRKEIPRSIEISPRKSPRKDEKPFYQHCLVKTCVTNDKNRHTYPKSVQISPKKLLRSNTDTGMFVSASGVQTDSIKETDTITPEITITQKINKEVLSMTKNTDSDQNEKNKASSKESSETERSAPQKDSSSETHSRKSSGVSEKDPIMDMIKDITKRYAKRDIDKNKKKKCFKEIMNVLNYLLNTDDGADVEHLKLSGSSATSDSDCSKNVKEKGDCGYTLKKVKKINPEYLKFSKTSDSNVRKEKTEKCQCCNKASEKSCCKVSQTDMPYVEYRNKQDKAVQSSLRMGCNIYTDSSEIPATTEFPSTSSDSATCKVLNKIRKQCEKYHQKRCKTHCAKKCEASSSTSVSCEQCQRIHHCPCRGHRCYRTKSSADKIKKKCVAYNLIIQTSDSMISEETVVNDVQPLRNVVVKVPQKRKQMEKAPFKEVLTKIEKTIPRCSLRGDSKTFRSRSLPNENEISSVCDGYGKNNRVYTVREYLEVNRPDFVEKSSNRQECLKHICERREENPCAPCESTANCLPNLKMVVVHTPSCMRPMESCNMYCGGVQMSCNCNPYNPYMQCVQGDVTRIEVKTSKIDEAMLTKKHKHQALTNFDGCKPDLGSQVVKAAARNAEGAWFDSRLRAIERANQRQLLSVQLDRRPSLTSLSETELRRLAENLGMNLRRKKLAPKFTSEREMKMHSEKIYKALPEVVQKKEDAKKENVKKTNLLMANIFKKNLQKKTLRGSVNLSNYSTVIKI